MKYLIAIVLLLLPITVSADEFFFEERNIGSHSDLTINSDELNFNAGDYIFISGWGLKAACTTNETRFLLPMTIEITGLGTFTENNVYTGSGTSNCTGGHNFDYIATTTGSVEVDLVDSLDLMIDTRLSVGVISKTSMENIQYIILPELIIIFLLTLLVILYIFNFRNPWK